MQVSNKFVRFLIWEWNNLEVEVQGMLWLLALFGGFIGFTVLGSYYENWLFLVGAIFWIFLMISPLIKMLVEEFVDDWRNFNKDSE